MRLVLFLALLSIQRAKPTTAGAHLLAAVEYGPSVLRQFHVTPNGRLESRG